MRKLENEKINRLENGVNANNTTKGNRQVELFGRVGQVRGGVVVFGRKRKGSEEETERF